MSLRRATSKEFKLQPNAEPLLQSPILLDDEEEELSDDESEDDGVVGVESSAEILGVGVMDFYCWLHRRNHTLEEGEQGTRQKSSRGCRIQGRRSDKRRFKSYSAWKTQIIGESAYLSPSFM